MSAESWFLSFKNRHKTETGFAGLYCVLVNGNASTMTPVTGGDEG
jgi:hypothetical protein